MVDTTARLVLEADSRQIKTAEKDLKKLTDTTDKADDSVGLLGRTFAVASANLIALSSAAVAFVGAALFKGAIEEGDKFQRSMLRTQAILDATGNKAIFTAEELRAQAEDLAFATLASTEGVQAAQERLLAFGKIAGDQFKRVTELAIDLSRVTKTDVAGAMSVLTRALEDPVRGMEQLRRSNIFLDEATKETIKSLDEQGRTAEAANLIIEKVAATFGGLARKEAQGFAGAVDTLGQSWEELKIEINNVLGLSDKVASFFSIISDGAIAAKNFLRGAFGGETISEIVRLQTELKNLDEEIAGFNKFESLAGTPLQDIAQAAVGIIGRNKRELDDLLDKREQVVEKIKKENAKIANEAQKTIEIDGAVPGAKTTEPDSGKKTKVAISDADRFLQALKEQAEQAGLTQIEITELKASQLGLGDAAKIYIDRIKEVSAEQEITAEKTQRMNQALIDVDRILLDSATAGERFGMEIEKINQLLDDGLSIDKANVLLDDSFKKLADFGKKGKDEFSELERAAQRWGRSSADAVANFAVSGAASFKDFAGSVIRELIAITVQQKITGPLFKAFGDVLGGVSFGGAGGGGGSGSVGIAKRANGGSVSGGIFEINERGEPEILNSGNRQFLLMPQGSNGSVQPVLNPSGGSSGSSGGGQGQGEIKVNIIESPGKGGEVQQRQTPQGVELDVLLDQLVAKKQTQRNSAQNRSLRQNFGLGEPLVAR